MSPTTPMIWTAAPSGCGRSVLAERRRRASPTARSRRSPRRWRPRGPRRCRPIRSRGRRAAACRASRRNPARYSETRFRQLLRRVVEHERAARTRRSSGGRRDAYPTDSTPGSAAIRSAMSFCMRTTRGNSGTLNGSQIRNVCTCSGSWTPGSTTRSATKLRIMRPEAISSTSESATCATTSVLRARCRLAAGAVGARGAAQRVDDARGRVFRDRDQANSSAAQQRDAEREQRDVGADLDVERARQRAAGEPQQRG